MLTRWLAFTRFLDDGRICVTKHAAERALRGIAPGRRLFAGSDRGGERAAAMYTLIATAKLNDINPQLGLPTCCAASPTIRPRGSTSFSSGIGRCPAIRPPPLNAQPAAVLGGRLPIKGTFQRTIGDKMGDYERTLSETKHMVVETDARSPQTRRTLGFGKTGSQALSG
jgi:transposase IS66 family protein